MRVDERESTSELLCEGTNIALRESPSAVNDPVEKRIGLGCIVAMLGPGPCSGRKRTSGGWM
jgi:hypothetical protein